MTNEIVLLKLGGSLITDKDKPFTPRLDKLADLAQEIKTALDSNPELLLILGHGSGSFGHVAAKQAWHAGRRAHPRTMDGIRRSPFSGGGVEPHVMKSLIQAGVPACHFPHRLQWFQITAKSSPQYLTIRKALDVRLLPVVQGDVAFDEALGGTILSTEDVFKFLVEKFSPRGFCWRESKPGCGRISQRGQSW
jgi:isopentenyl phosphate kinase